ncbi:CBS domain-containing protein [Pendulispora brunnea]|uniref:CBS domain-containing protein n=1 Tax=Pendulispora brunnea TaxID=2905690 RepID=A0ABZ2JZ32_9BACT
MLTSIRDIMSPTIVCVLANAGWESLERLLLDEEFEAVPVVDAQGRPVGIVSKTDLLRHTRCGEGEVTAPRGGRAPEPGMHIDRRAAITAEDVMTPIVHALPEEAPVSFAIAALALEGVAQIPIVSSEGVVVGMLCASDAVTWLARELGCIALTPCGARPPSAARRDP